MRGAHHTSAIALMGFLSFLFGCEPKKSLFEKRPEGWFYNGAPIEGSDAATFEVLADHYARDRNQVYWLDTYRSSQDYFTTKRSRIFAVKGADPASFRYIDDGYAKDSSHVFYEGVAFPVKDVQSFELLENGFARDHVIGYYHQVQVRESDGRTFTVLDGHHAKDSAHVYYSEIVSDSGGTKPPYGKTVRVPEADVATFSVLGDDYAADAKRVYYQGKLLTTEVASFQVLSYGYAKSNRTVFYFGKPVTGADAATFVMLDSVSMSADARDARALYQQGHRAKPEAPPD